MKNLVNLMRAFWMDESGQDMAEYALLLVLIAVVVAAAVIAFRGAIIGGFEDAQETLENPEGVPEG